MKLLNLLMWVVQFGFSILFPTVFFLILAVWLQINLALVCGSWSCWALWVCLPPSAPPGRA